MLDINDYSNICEHVVRTAKSAGAYIAKHKDGIDPEKIKSKGTHDFVTEVDKNTELLIVKELENLIPEAGFITEEGTITKSGEKYNWIIDPLDGTTNFIHGAPPVAVSIALVENNIPVIGVVYEVWHEECFYTRKDGPAYLNGKEIRVSETKSVKDSLIATGFPYNSMNRLPSFMKTLDYFFHNSHGVRRLGSAAADLAYVACGRYDGFYEYNLKPWDVAAGALLVMQAGGCIADFKGGDQYIFGKEVVASNKHIHESFRENIEEIMS